MNGHPPREPLIKKAQTVHSSKTKKISVRKKIAKTISDKKLLNLKTKTVEVKHGPKTEKICCGI